MRIINKILLAVLIPTVIVGLIVIIITLFVDFKTMTPYEGQTELDIKVSSEFGTRFVMCGLVEETNTCVGITTGEFLGYKPILENETENAKIMYIFNKIPFSSLPQLHITHYRILGSQ